MLVPKLRFQSDDGTNYPEWTKGYLSDIAKKVNRKANAGSTAPVMMISQGNGFIYQSDRYSHDNAGKSLAKYTLLRKGEMAYNHGASKLKPYGVAYCLQEEDEARVPSVYRSFKVENGVPLYWNYALNLPQIDRQLQKMVATSTRIDGLLGISFDTYMQTQIFLPSIEEQQKIADFLSAVDEVIAQSKSKIQNLEQQKKTAMQKIFSQEVRFRREDGTEYPKWEEKLFGTIMNCYSGGTPSSKNKQYYNGGIPFIRSGEIHSSQTKLFLSEEGLKHSSAKIVSTGDLLYALYGATGGEVDISKIDGAVNQAILCIVPHNDNRLYLKYWLECFKTKIRSKLLQGGQGNLSAELIKSLLIDIPHPEEQQKIADFLSDYDEAISCAKQELEYWKQFKKGLLQQMFI